jgi:lactate dehydrogenase-like 2-hydroxyacid dehydrogenase
MKRQSILLTRRWPEAVETYLCARYDVELNAEDRPLDRAAFIDAMQRFDAICPTVSDKLDAEIVGVSDARARIIANYGVGYDHVDLDAARRAAITVTNTPGVLTEATADLALLLILMTSRRAGEGERELRAGRWTGWRPTHMMGQSISGKLLGLVGLGRIAMATAMRARALGMRIAYHGRRRATPEDEAALDATFVPSLEELAASADILSIHCPGGPATHHLIDAALLNRMKPSAILINTARGTIVDEAALAEACASGRIAGAGLDVFEREPAVAARLLELESVVLLPHLGSATIEVRTAMGMRVAANLESFFSGQGAMDRVV